VEASVLPFAITLTYLPESHLAPCV